MGSAAKKTGSTKATQKRHVCACGKDARPVLVLPERKIRYQCEGGHRSNRNKVTLA